jgi:maleamate amidohydrolase
MTGFERGASMTGFGGAVRLGSRPAVVVVDMSRGFTDPASPLACDLEAVVAAIAELLAVARAAGHPVIYTTVAYGAADRATAAAFIDKVPALLALEQGSALTEIDPRLAPAPGDPVLTKLYASAFFGTPLASLLVAARVDTLLVTGASTSGCVRATAVDALQHGYPTVVPRQCVGDRDPSAHEANLFDLAAKYAEVVDASTASAFLRSVATAAA